MTKRKLSLMLAVVLMAALAVPNVVFGSDYTEHWQKKLYKNGLTAIE